MVDNFSRNRQVNHNRTYRGIKEQTRNGFNMLALCNQEDCHLLNIWNHLSDTTQISIGTCAGYRLRVTLRKRNIDTSSTGAACFWGMASVGSWNEGGDCLCVQYHALLEALISLPFRKLLRDQTRHQSAAARLIERGVLQQERTSGRRLVRTEDTT